MQRKTTPARRAPSTNRVDALAKFRRRSNIILDIFFDERTPRFVRDLLASWLARLENETQIYAANSRAIASVQLPLMLAEAERMGLDAEAPDSTPALEAFAESMGLNESRERYTPKPSERDLLLAELEKEAAALALLLNSKHLPSGIRTTLGVAAANLLGCVSEEPGTIRAAYPLAILLREEKGARDENSI
jgi:hypothetical protein